MTDLHDFSLFGCLNYLSSIEARTNFKKRKRELLNLYGENLLREILPVERKDSVRFEELLDIGGEAVLLKGWCDTHLRDSVFKVAFSDANLKGQQLVIQDTKDVYYFNIVKERFGRGGLRIQAALSETIPRSIGYIPFVRTGNLNPVYMEMEYLSGENPLIYYKDKDFREIFQYFYNLLVYMREVHGKTVLHRDLKINNIVVVTDDDDKPGIFDWTFSKRKGDEEKTNYDDLTKMANLYFTIHSSVFSSQKLISGNSEQADETDDIFSLGRIMYCLFARHYPRKVEEINLGLLPGGS